MKSSLIDRVVINTKPVVLLIGADGSESLADCSLALQGNGFCVVRTNIKSGRGNYEACHPKVVVMESEGKLKDLVKIAWRILSLDSEARIIFLNDSRAVYEDLERIGIDIFMTKPIHMQRFLASVETLLHSKRPYITIEK